MSGGMRWVVVVGSAVLITALLSIAGTVFFVLEQPRPDVPLTEGLQGNWDRINRDFDARVRRQFPIGSPESAMTAELQREGFLREDWSYVTPRGAEAVATRREDRIVCRQAAIVYWRASPQGRLTSIRGLYRVEACL